MLLAFPTITMSYTQLSKEKNVNVLLHKTHPTYIKKVEIPAGLSLDKTCQQVQMHAACHLRADALPDASEVIIVHGRFFTTFSKILLLGNPEGHPVTTSCGVFAEGADVQAVVPTKTDLLPQPVTG